MYSLPHTYKIPANTSTGREGTVLHSMTAATLDLAGGGGGSEMGAVTLIDVLHGKKVCMSCCHRKQKEKKTALKIAFYFCIFYEHWLLNVTKRTLFMLVFTCYYEKCFLFLSFFPSFFFSYER